MIDYNFTLSDLNSYLNRNFKYENWETILVS